MCIYERERLACLQHYSVNIVDKAYFHKMSIHITKVLIILATVLDILQVTICSQHG